MAGVEAVKLNKLNDVDDVVLTESVILPNNNGAVELEDGAWNKLTPAGKLLLKPGAVELGLLPKYPNDNVLDDTADESVTVGGKDVTVLDVKFIPTPEKLVFRKFPLKDGKFMPILGVG